MRRKATQQGQGSYKTSPPVTDRGGAQGGTQRSAQRIARERPKGLSQEAK